MANGFEMERFYKLTIRVLVSIIVLVGGFFGKLGVERALVWADTMEIRMQSVETNAALTAQWVGIPQDQIIWPKGLRPLIRLESDNKFIKKPKLGMMADD